MSARARFLAHHGFVGGALMAALGLLIGFHAVVSDAVTRAHLHHDFRAAQASANPPLAQRTLVARRGE